MSDDAQTPPRVYLVGAGPGDPSAITLRAVACLGKADLVLYDYLVNPRVLDHAAADAELVCLGRHGKGRIMRPDEVTQRMVSASQSGKTVVRLKCGDPFIFARGGEEVEALSAAGIPFEVVGGMTAALAAGSYAGVPLTHRKHASAVALVTGHQGTESMPLDFAALAKFPGTLVCYMGVTTSRTWTSALIDAGRNPDEPAAIIRRCSWPDQSLIRCSLRTVAEEIERRKLRPPVTVILGDVVKEAEAVNWFADRPMFGQTVLVTRSTHQAGALAELLEEQGAGVLTQPAIEIAQPDDWTHVDQAIGEQVSRPFDWIVFSSANGVQHFLKRLSATGRDVRALARSQLAVIGSATAMALARYHLQADLTPDEFRAEALAEALAKGANGKRFLLIRASRGRDVLAKALQSAGGELAEIVVYESRDVAQPDDAVVSALGEGKIDWVTVTSSAIARNLVVMFGDSLRKARLASISPITTSTLRDLGFDVAAEADEYTMPGLVEAMCAAEAQSR
ncbi:MAG: uroporphyrinogen-III C-methyltransferase [Pirellulales bacterium]|nr:uroporphyrinogen-III C-methyltransferase [Pirellulales bacterium]